MYVILNLIWNLFCIFFFKMKNMLVNVEIFLSIEINNCCFIGILDIGMFYFVLFIVLIVLYVMLIFCIL